MRSGSVLNGLAVLDGPRLQELGSLVCSDGLRSQSSGVK